MGSTGGWNRPTDNQPTAKKGGAKAPSKLRGAIALVTVVVIGGVAAWWFTRPVERVSVEKEVQRPTKIDDVGKRVTNKVAVAESAKPQGKEKIDKNKLYRDANGKVIFHPECPVGSPANPIRLAPINKPGNIVPPKKLYDTFAENYVVGILRTKPGMPVVGTALPRNFDEEFKARIADPVGIKDDDTEEDIAMRKTMVEVKKEMAQLIADGMTPSEIILAEREKLNRLADTRRTMLKEISELRKSGADQSEVDLMVDAANKILKEKGISEIKVPAILKNLAKSRAEGRPTAVPSTPAVNNEH